MKLKKKHIRYLVLLIAIATAIPLPVGFFNGLPVWLSPLNLGGRLLARHPLAWLNILGFASFILIILRKRWICRFACPTGIICDAGSSLGRKRNYGKWYLNRILAILILTMAIFGVPLLLVLDPFNIFYASLEFARTGIGTAAIIKFSALFFLFVFSIFFPGLWCAGICPLGGFQDLMYKTKSLFTHPGRPTEKKAGGRRAFLGIAGGSLAAILLPKIARGNPQPRIRPPFSLAGSAFCFVCVRCGNCVASCPTGIITPVVKTGRVEEFLTPEISFESSYCLPECNNCGAVCPSGAIETFRPDEKAVYKMAAINIRLEDCLLMERKECFQCRQYCSYNAIEMKKHPVHNISLPVVNHDKCTGCAACKIVCPAEVISVKSLNQVTGS